MSRVWKPVINPPSPNSLSVSGLSRLGTKIYKIMVLEEVNKLKNEETEIYGMENNRVETVRNFNKSLSSYYYAQSLLDEENEGEMSVDEEHTNCEINENVNAFTQVTNRSWFREKSLECNIATTNRDCISPNLNKNSEYVNEYFTVMKSLTQNSISSEVDIFENYDEPEMCGSLEYKTIKRDYGCTSNTSRDNTKKLIPNNPTTITNTKCINKQFTIVNNKNKNKNKKYKQLRIDGFFREKTNLHNKKNNNRFSVFKAI